MKRFYKRAETAAGEGGYAIRLDGKELKTPARQKLLLPNEALGGAIACEWDAQGETIEPEAMPLTGLANAAIDRIAPQRRHFVEHVAGFAKSDLLCYRAGDPQSLVSRQAASWDPLIEWAEERYDISFRIVTGVMPVAQPAQTLDRLARAVEAHDDFALAALGSLAGIGGSLIAALALAERRCSAEDAWRAVNFEALWQEERWGSDPIAESARAARRRDFDAAARFLDLTGAGGRA